eukprot:747785_1
MSEYKWEVLRDGVRQARELGITGAPEIDRAEDFLGKVDQLLGYTKEAVSSVNKQSLEWVLSEAKSLNLSDVDQILSASNLLQRIVYAEGLIAEATERVVEEELRDALSSATEINYECDVVAQCRTFYNQILEAHANILASSAARNRDEMTSAIDNAYALGLNSPRVQACVVLRNRIDRILQVEPAAKAILSQGQMKVLIAASDAIEFSTEAIKLFKSLMVLPKHSLLKEQMRAAAKIGDNDRLIWTNIELKGWFFNQCPPLPISECPAVKHRIDWSNEKMLCLHRDELAASFLKFTDTHIHSHLTKIPANPNKTPKEVAKLARQMFGYVQGYMRDKKLKKGEDPCLSILPAIDWCCKGVILRDEMYVQIMKQLTDNPAKESENKGWELLKICLSTFPPSDILENYLESWIRSRAHHTDVMLTRFHRTKWRVAAAKGPPDAPTQSKVKEIVNDTSAAGFTEPLPDPATYSDLTQPFDAPEIVRSALGENATPGPMVPAENWTGPRTANVTGGPSKGPTVGGSSKTRPPKKLPRKSQMLGGPPKSQMPGGPPKSAGGPPKSPGGPPKSPGGPPKSPGGPPKSPGGPPKSPGGPP